MIALDDAEEAQSVVDMMSKLMQRHVLDFRGAITVTKDGLSISTDDGRQAILNLQGFLTRTVVKDIVDHGFVRLLAVASLGTLVAALLNHVEPKSPPILASPDLLFTAIPESRNSEWLGFVPVTGGWIGVALVHEMDRKLFAAILSRSGGSQSTPMQLAGILQEFGIAALPAVASRSHKVVADTKKKASSAPLLSQGGQSPQCLRPYRFVEIGRAVAAPFAGRILSLCGATVQSVRPRGLGYGVGEELNFCENADQAHLTRMVRNSHGVIENLSHRAGRRLLGLSSLNSEYSWISIRGFPATSKLDDWRVYGFLAEAYFAIGCVPAIDSERWVPAARVPLLDRAVGLLAAAEAISGLSLAAKTRFTEISLCGQAEVLSESTKLSYAP